MEVAGRIKIFTDEKEITRENIIPILQKAYAKHRLNARKMQELIDFHGGLQKLPYQKIVRPEVNIQTVDNLAKYVTTFHCGYFWGIPAIFTQRGNNEHHKTDADTDSYGISALNEMMLNGISIGKENQKLAYWVEVCGIGHRLVDIKRDWENEEHQSSYADLYTLDPRNAFCVYHNGIGEKKMLGVTFFRTSSGKISYTCFTDTTQYEIGAWKIESEEPNLLGKIPIVEYERAIDLSGCFESQVDMMDNLNSLTSSFCNDSVQRTQEIWFGTNFDLPKDENGNTVKIENGKWIIAQSTQDGKEPKLQPLASTLDGQATLTGIESTRNEILKECYVPVSTGEGNNSTGVAQNVISGWSATETDAARKEQLIRGSDKEQLDLILRAIKYVPTKILPADDPLRKVHASDVDIKYIRSKAYDLNSKCNALGTLLAHGIEARQAIKATNVFDDSEQAYLDSSELIEQFQEHAFGETKEEKTESTENRLSQDLGDQSENSPIIDSMNTSQKSME